MRRYACYLPMLLLGLTAQVYSQIQLVSYTSEQLARVGDRAVFAVEVSSATPAYTWFFAGVEQNSHAATFETPELGLAHNGSEVICFVSDSAGHSLTLKGVVKVLPPSLRTLLLEGELEDRLGNGNMQVDLEVLLYAQPTGGAPLYRETFFASGENAVPVADGRFQVRLGTQSAELAELIAKTTDLYAEFRVGAGEVLETMAPRLPVTAVPYSLSTSALAADSVQGTP